MSRLGCYALEDPQFYYVNHATSAYSTYSVANLFQNTTSELSEPVQLVCNALDYINGAYE